MAHKQPVSSWLASNLLPKSTCMSTSKNCIMLDIRVAIAEALPSTISDRSLQSVTFMLVLRRVDIAVSIAFLFGVLYPMSGDDNVVDCSSQCKVLANAIFSPRTMACRLFPPGYISLLAFSPSFRILQFSHIHNFQVNPNLLRLKTILSVCYGTSRYQLWREIAAEPN